ncbi:hypothetical protein [Rheinheimera fenheensis]|uniref:hypothetical protein n=1 Tax=Rheinheimera fenheensis TaxID=3152295 RepID=UPI0032606D13
MLKLKWVVVAAVSLMLTACASAPYVAQPSELTAPPAIMDNSGEYMSPFTSDGVVAEWVDKAVNAKAGASIGGMAGAYAGQKLAENIPFIGGFIGEAVGNTLGREVALNMSGGEEFIRSTSDISFHNLNDMAVWLYVNYSANPHYQDALDSTFAIYPDLQQVYYQALINASAAVAPTN